MAPERDLCLKMPGPRAGGCGGEAGWRWPYRAAHRVNSLRLGDGRKPEIALGATAAGNAENLDLHARDALFDHAEFSGGAA